MQSFLIRLAGSVAEYDGDAVKLQYFRLFISNYKTLGFGGLFVGLVVCFGDLVWFFLPCSERELRL